MHPTQLHDPIHAVPSCDSGQDIFPFAISYAQAQGLQRSVKLRDDFQQVIHRQHAKGPPLDRIWHIRALAQKNRPIRGCWKNRSVALLVEQPRSTGETDRGTQRRFDLLTWMDPVLLFKRLLKILDELLGITPCAALEKKSLGR